MGEHLGDFVLVLHGHLPYVLNHGTWPHGEDWLYEAAAETYLPLLNVIDEVHYLGGWPGMTIGLTPVLLEQLAHPTFKQGFIEYLEDRVQRARSDRAEFSRFDDGYHKHLVWLTEYWEEYYSKLAQRFDDIGHDLPGAFGMRAQAGSIEILTSNATHGYMPLLLEDSSVRAQMRAGIASSERLLGFKPTGMWLPECAYRPAYPWKPSVVYGDIRNRIGIEHLVADEGITHFFVEHHLIENSRSEGVFDANGQYHRVGWEEGAKYPGRGWYDVHDAFWVNSDGGPGRVVAMGRDPRVCEQVWSGTIGYPADGTYLEFHKKHGERRGLRYWKVTGKGVDLGQKQLYHPPDVSSKLHEQAHHFCDLVKSQLAEYKAKTGRTGMVVATFDAELFGHWWFEGPRFLRDVLLSMHHDPQVEIKTSSQRVKETPPDKVVALPEGSWGDSGDHSVWMNEQTRWIWEVEYRAEALFGKNTFTLPWREPKNVQLREILEHAGRELLLMQASDWPFVITRGQAIDYGIKRFVLHAGRFENLISMAETVARGEPLSEIQEFELQDALLHDTIFPKIDLTWWNM